MKLQTEIKRHGQPVYDEAIYAHPKRPSVIKATLVNLFGRQLPQPILTGYRRVKLNWVKQPKVMP